MFSRKQIYFTCEFAVRNRKVIASPEKFTKVELPGSCTMVFNYEKWILKPFGDGSVILGLPSFLV
jgi:hypothetical protein